MFCLRDMIGISQKCNGPALSCYKQTCLIEHKLWISTFVILCQFIHFSVFIYQERIFYTALKFLKHY